MDNLKYLRSWITGSGVTQAVLQGEVTQKEKDDLFFTSCYLLLESGMVEIVHLSAVDLAMRCAGLSERNVNLATSILLVSANTQLGHLYFEPSSSEIEIVENIQSFVDSQKSSFKDVVHSDLLQELCNSEALNEYFIHSVSNCLSDVGSYGSALTSIDDETVSLLKYDVNHGLYSHKLLTSEVEISRWFHNKFESSVDVKSMNLKNILQEVLVENPMMMGDAIMHFHSRQQAAIALCAQKQFSIISGGPGTGKTSTVVSLLRVLMRLYPDIHHTEIAMVAPTGRAAARMEESVKASVGQIREIVDGSRDSELKHVEATTIHRFLKYNPGRNHYTYSADNRHPAKVIIADEVSMIDAQLFLDMTHALNDDVIVILLGDHNQLPSVQPGAVLSDLFGKGIPEGNPSLSKEAIDSILNILPRFSESDVKGISSLYLKQEHILKDSMVVLSKSHRSEASILELSHAVNKQDANSAATFLSTPINRDGQEVKWPLVYKQADGTKRCNGNGVELWDVLSDADRMNKGFNELIESWCDFHFLSDTYVKTEGLAFSRTDSYYGLIKSIETTFGEGERSTIELEEVVSKSEKLSDLFTELFAYMNQSQILCATRNGATGVNTINANVVEYIRKKRSFTVENGVFAGLPIIITQNDNLRKVYNGDCGVVVKIDSKHYIAIQNSSKVSLFPVSDVAHFAPAYAITVHKSQGSEYEYVLLVLPKEMNRVMTKEILYTAITRAKYYAGIVSSMESFQRCIQNSISRRSAISQRVLSMS